MNPLEPLAPGTRFRSDVPARLDRLPWSQWHAGVVVALGIVWMLDGLEVTLVGAIAPVLGETDTLHLSDSQIGGTATAYLAGAVGGALFFGRLTDMFGRKRLFLVTLGLYTSATLLTALSWSFWSLAAFRALTGAGIGGEYSAVNSAIDELLPARLRGRADLAVNATYWLGTALGAALTLPLLDPRIFPHRLGWRLAFLAGGVLGAAILLLRRRIPESPRWFLLHGRPEEADRVVRRIEREIQRTRRGRPRKAGRFARRVERETPNERREVARPAPADAPRGAGGPVEPERPHGQRERSGEAGRVETETLRGRRATTPAAPADAGRGAGGPEPPLGAGAEEREIEAKGNVTLASIVRALVRRRARRTVLGLSLMVAQAFAYNGVFFTYALVLTRFYGVAAKDVGLFLIPFAFGNLLGPIALGPLFDVAGRRLMISATYVVSGVLIAATGYAMARGWLTAGTQTALWCAAFFVASAAASSAYLTVGELFPVELRATAIALFYAAGTGAGGLVAPSLFGWLVQSGSPRRVLVGYLLGAALMIAAGLVAAILGVPAEGKSLEQIAELDR